MGRPVKRKKERRENTKAIFLVGLVLVFLGAMLILNIVTSMKRMKAKECLQNMILLGEAMQTIQDEYGAVFDPEAQDPKQIITYMKYYFTYNKEVFRKNQSGTLALLSEEELSQLRIPRKKENLLSTVGTCPAGGTYSFTKSLTKTGLLDIDCDKHGLLLLPDEKGRYGFSGSLNILPIREVEIGREATFTFPPSIPINKKTVNIKPYKKEEEGQRTR